MSTQEAREIFNQAIAQAKDADQIAKLELAREYFTNAQFRSQLQQYVWEQNNK